MNENPTNGENEFDSQQSNTDPFSDGSDAVVQKAKDPKKALKDLIIYLSPHKKSFMISLFFAMFSSVFAVIGPRLLGRVTTSLVDGIVAFYMGTGLLTNFPYMLMIMGWLIVAYAVSAVCSFAQGNIMAKLAMKVTYSLRTEISQKMHRLPINYYDTRSHGEILSRITNDVDTMSQTLGQSLTQIVTAATTLVGVLVMMIWISPLMTLAALVVVPISMGIMMAILTRSQKYFADQQEALGKVSGIVEETYSGLTIVRSYNGEEDAQEKFTKANSDLRTASWKAQFMTGIVEPIFWFIDSISYVMVCVLGGYLAVRRIITIGDVQAFIQYMQNFINPLTQLSATSNIMQGTIAAAERVFEFLAEEEEKEDIQKEEQESRDYSGKVTFKKVRFGYNPEKIIIHDFSAEIAPGQTVAIVGPTGAGKTTVVKLLMRFYELNSGQILIDDVPSTGFTRGDLRDIFGMVLQDTWIYNATIMENIRYGSPNATDEDVIKAAKTAQCHNFIRTLPGGYNMVLNEEASNISQGQKQLFTIARVVLRDPAILILDEATSSIDTRTEILIQKAMKNIMKGRTSFIIAHRLSTIKDADLILVMKDGDIIEKGDHQGLLDSKGFYADLYNSQFTDSDELPA